MSIEYFPSRADRPPRPKLRRQVGTWGEMWCQALWETNPERYRRLYGRADQLEKMAELREERASRQLQDAMRQLERQHGPVPRNPVDALQWRAPLANQARELVLHDLLSELRSVRRELNRE